MPGRAPVVLTPSKPHVIVTSGSDERMSSGIEKGFDNFIRTKAPNDLRQLGPTRIKRILTKEWGTSHFRGRIGSVLVTGIEVPPLLVLRKKFETRCNGGKPINWPACNEWAAEIAESTYPDVQMPDDAAVALGTPHRADFFIVKMCTVVHGRCTITNSSCLTAAAVVHDVHDVRGPGGNSGGRGPWSSTGGPWSPKGASSYPFLILSLKHAQREQRAQPLCRSGFFVHDVHVVHDAQYARCARFVAWTNPPPVAPSYLRLTQRGGKHPLPKQKRLNGATVTICRELGIPIK